MSRLVRPAAFLTLLAMAGAVASVEPPGQPPAGALAVEQGLVVELDAGTGGAPAAGQAVRFRFLIRDQSAGAPLAGLDPAAWLAPREAGEPSSPDLCRRKLRTYLSGSLFSRPALDLNGYQVLMMGEEPRIQAVEPDFGFGMPRLLADVELPAPAFDWVLDGAHRYVFLTLPEAGTVARLDTHSWKLETIAGWQRPERLALQPDGHYLWVAAAGGVVAFTTEPFALAGPVATHPEQQAPPSALEFSADGRLLFVAHGGSSSLATIDAARREPLPPLELPGRPASMAFSALARRLFLTLEGPEGRILAVDEKPGVTGSIAAPPRPGLILFAGDGRYGIVLHPEESRLSILDSARGRVVQTAALAGIPDQLSFSSELAYLRLRDRTELLMLPLQVLGREGEMIPTFDTVGGDRGFVDGFRPIPAAGIAQPPGVAGMLIANPGDRAVYFYKEGLAAPMGQLLTKISPRAVLALDRSLREVEAKGAYETTLPLPAAGDYDLAFFLASPRIVHCFPIRIENAPSPLEPENVSK